MCLMALIWDALCFCMCSDLPPPLPLLPPQFSEEQRFNSFLRALREKVEMKQLNHFWEIVIQGKVSFVFFPKYLYFFSQV